MNHRTLKSFLKDSRRNKVMYEEAKLFVKQVEFGKPAIIRTGFSDCPTPKPKDLWDNKEAEFNSVYNATIRNLTSKPKYHGWVKAIMLAIRNAYYKRSTPEFKVIGTEEPKVVPKLELREDPDKERIEIYAYACPPFLREPHPDDKSFAARVERCALDSGISQRMPETFRKNGMRAQMQSERDKRKFQRRLDYSESSSDSDSEDPVYDDYGEIVDREDPLYRYYRMEMKGIDITASSYVRDLTMEGIEPNPGPRTYYNNKKKRNNKLRRNRRPPRADTNIRINNIMPYRKTATLTYFDASPVRNAPGASFLVYSMRVNDLYDPDPLILSGSISNFKEMMQFYSYYRVLSVAIRWSVVNLENFPLTCGIVFSQTNLTGVIGTLADCQNAFENDFTTPVKVLSGKGGMDKALIVVRPLTMAKLLGVGKQYYADIDYAGLGLSTPAIPLWANFIAYSPTGAAMTNGYANNTTLMMKSQFFGRLNNQT